ncbi:MAG TPA: methionyl-tRNA formyltransferase [Trueperaceae bacterium]|nr:methionyl-tRNA formyltransferase [Trueperaceae bacterium]
MPARPLRVAFFGSPEFALPALEAVAQRHHVVLVVSQPDKPAGRGLKLRAPPVATRAQELGLDLVQPRAVRGEEFLQRLAGARPDVGVTAAYGRILVPAVLSIPQHGVLNVHASLLPKYRGAAPIQWALINDEKETGITIMQTEEGLDTGPIRLQRRTPIGAEEDATALMSRLALLGAETLIESLDLLGEGTLPSTTQDDEAATLAPLLTSEDGDIRWTDSVTAVLARHRGVAAWPGTAFTHNGARVKVLEMDSDPRDPATPAPRAHPAPGTVTAVSQAGVSVVTGSGTLLLERVKPAGARAMSAHEWSLGRGAREGEILG